MVLLGEGAGRFRPDHRFVARLSMLTSSRGDAFEYVGARATDVALGDLNGDGKLDAALATRFGGGAVVVRFGRDDEFFGDAHTYQSGADPTDVALADVNHDGRLDIAVAEHGAGAVSVFVGNGDGTLGARRAYRMSKWRGYGVDAVHVGDFDRDGNLDLAAYGTGGVVVRRGAGDGSFLRAQTASPLGTASVAGGTVADINADGWPDLAFVRWDYGDAWGYVLLNWTGQPAPPCVVPDLRYGAWPSAIRFTGCRRGHARRRFSRTVPMGDTISQRPSAGEVLPNGSRVDIVISRGRRR
jgi:VCBS repeat protein